MSKYKDQIKEHFNYIGITTDAILSIGGQIDDKSYFDKIECKEWITLDSNLEFKPQINFDMNRSLDGEGGYEIPDKYLGYFDYVLALNLFEYIYDPLTAHRNITDLLKPGGTYIANYPFIYPLHNPPATDFLRYTPEGVEKFLKLAGLTIESHDYIYGNTLLKTYYAMDGLKARDGFDHQIIGSIIKAKKG